MRSYYKKDFSQDDNRHTQQTLDQLKITDPQKYEEYMRLKMQQSWEEVHGGPSILKIADQTDGLTDSTQR